MFGKLFGLSQSDRASQIHALGDRYHDTYKLTRSLADLELAIQKFKEALDITPLNHPDRVRRLHNLGLRYGNKFQRIGLTSDLEQAIHFVQEAVDTVPQDHPDRLVLLQNLGINYQQKYRRTNVVADLAQAIQLKREALAITPSNHPDRAKRLQSLGIGYGDKYKATGDIADLEESLRLNQVALDLTPSHHPDRASRLESLGVSYTDKYRISGDVSNLIQAIRQYQEALNIAAPDDKSRPRRLRNLGIAYRDKYESTGDISDLEHAIEQFCGALDSTAPDDPQRSRRLQSLGLGYSKRYEKVGAMADLDKSIQLFQEALELTPPDHSDRALLLQSIGYGYGAKYRRTEDKQYLDKAIDQIQKSLGLTPQGHIHLAERLSQLGTAYLDRYRSAGVISDLEVVIQQFQKVVDITPPNHIDRAERLLQLGVAYQDKYRSTKAISDLEKAIEHAQAALELTPLNHQRRALRCQSLATFYAYKHEMTNTLNDLEHAIRLHNEALDHDASLVKDRLRPGITLVYLYARAKDWSQAYQAASKTLSLVKILTPDSIESSDKQHLLTEIVGLASDAAATALNLNAAGAPVDAIRLLEIGRGVIAASLNELHADISALEQNHPALAKEYKALRAQLYATQTPTQHQGDGRFSAGQALEKMTQKIQTLPGFDQFLLPPSEDELKSAAERGPIVIVNISNYRCDALIIERTDIRVIPLPQLKIGDIRNYAKGRANRATLEWLWKTIAQPILSAMAMTQPPTDGCWRHIWWLPTGPIAKFPLHAAGIHAPGSFNTIIDRAMSSYCTSVKALIYGRHLRPQLARASIPKKAVLVAVQKTPGYDDLECAPTEILIVEGLCRSMSLKVSKPLPVNKDVLLALNDCSVFHFAGHGYTDKSDPFQSRLVLKDCEVVQLTVAKLLEMNLHVRPPFLAYLSACGTGQIKDEKFVDESIHLISACQLAGFRHVIGTLWEVNDAICVDMARITYEEIQKGGMTDESVCVGLHKAARELRDRWLHTLLATRSRKMGSARCRIGDGATSGDERSARLPRDVDLLEDDDGPLHWVPYVHFGV